MRAEEKEIGLATLDQVWRFDSIASVLIKGCQQRGELEISVVVFDRCDPFVCAVLVDLLEHQLRLPTDMAGIALVHDIGAEIAVRVIAVAEPCRIDGSPVLCIAYEGVFSRRVGALDVARLCDANAMLPIRLRSVEGGEVHQEFLVFPPLHDIRRPHGVRRPFRPWYIAQIWKRVLLERSPGFEVGAAGAVDVPAIFARTGRERVPNVINIGQSYARSQPCVEEA